MPAHRHKTKGFTLVELLAIIVLIGTLSAIVVSRMSSPSLFELQASRDQVIAAFRSAQQLAMAQGERVRFSTNGNELRIFLDSNGDASFTTAELIDVGGIDYPLALSAGQVITSANFDFDRLGRTSSTTLSIVHGGSSVDVNVSTMGFVK